MQVGKKEEGVRERDGMIRSESSVESLRRICLTLDLSPPSLDCNMINRGPSGFQRVPLNLLQCNEFSDVVLT